MSDKKLVDFDIVVPAMKQGGGDGYTKTIKVLAYTNASGEEILTPEAIDKIEQYQVHLQLKQLIAAVRELNWLPPLPDALDIDRTEAAANVAAPLEASGSFIKKLDKAIAFHQNNQNDPHGVGSAVIAALIEVRNAAL
jgi:hypothetical protein